MVSCRNKSCSANRWEPEHLQIFIRSSHFQPSLCDTDGGNAEIPHCWDECKDITIRRLKDPTFHGKFSITTRYFASLAAVIKQPLFALSLVHILPGLCLHLLEHRFSGLAAAFPLTPSTPRGWMVPVEEVWEERPEQGEIWSETRWLQHVAGGMCWEAQDQVW